MLLKKTKILVVDDEEILLRINKLMLTKHGYDVAVSNTARNIINVATAHTPDVIIMDHQMPDVTGMEATKTLKSSETYAHIPVIYFSSNNDIAELAAEAGADAYVLKSSGHKYLLAAVEKFTAQAF